jgi:hypothetical protein
MLSIADPVTQWAFIILVSVVLGTCLLIAVAFFRRWQQIRYIRYVHSLQRTYRPIVAKVLSGVRSRAEIEALRELQLADLELLLDPLFSRRKLPERNLVFLQALCAELGLADLWQGRLANGHSNSWGNGTREVFSGRAAMRYVLRAKSIRNLGTLRHRPSWPLLVNALNDRHRDIQLVALRSLAAVGAPESFPMLRQHLHAAVQGQSTSPPVPGLQSAMANFSLACAPDLLPSLRHPNPQIRMHAIEILRTMVCREAACRADPAFPQESLTPAVVELLLSGLAVDADAEIRARSAEIIVFLANPHALPKLRNLLLDREWFVRLRTVRALAHLDQAGVPLYGDIRECLRDPHWRVREGAIQTLISLGRAGRHHLFQYFLTCPDLVAREQIVELIERTGLMSTLVEEYSEGSNGLEALVVEQLASQAAPLGLPGVLRTMKPEIRQKFLDRVAPDAPSKAPLDEGIQREAETAANLQPADVFPPPQAA